VAIAVVVAVAAAEGIRSGRSVPLMPLRLSARRSDASSQPGESPATGSPLFRYAVA
jgi:hypothetical protein